MKPELRFKAVIFRDRDNLLNKVTHKRITVLLEELPEGCDTQDIQPVDSRYFHPVSNAMGTVVEGHEANGISLPSSFHFGTHIAQEPNHRVLTEFCHF